MENLQVSQFKKTTSSVAEKVARHRASKALSNARQRCNNPKNPDYPSYGAMGVEVRFKSLDQLITHIGLPSKALSLDRIDPNGHYELGNVRWASAAVQAANKKHSAVNLHLTDAALIAAQQDAAKMQARRKATTVCWIKAGWAYNRGYLSGHDAEFLSQHLNCVGVLQANFEVNTVADMANDSPGYIHLPALTLPDARVRIRAEPVNLPETDAWLKARGRLAILERLGHEWNVPESIWERALEACKTGSGLLLIQKSTPETLLAGGIEGMCLALASSLYREANFSTAFFPMLKLIHEIDALGSQWGWEDVAHPILDAQALLVPDFTLDCGEWGLLPPNRVWKAAALLDYRYQHKKTTIIGAPSFGRLPQSATHLVANGYRHLHIPFRKAHGLDDLNFSEVEYPIEDGQLRLSDIDCTPAFETIKYEQ